MLRSCGILNNLRSTKRLYQIGLLGKAPNPMGQYLLEEIVAMRLPYLDRGESHLAFHSGRLRYRNASFLIDAPVKVQENFA